MFWKIFARQPKTWQDSEDYARECYRAGVIAVGWNGVGDLNKIGSFEELKQKLTKLWPGDARSHPQWAGALWSFRNAVKPGHTVICPDRNSGRYYVGKVISSKVFYDKSALGGSRCRFAHRRKVKWSRRVLTSNEVRSVLADGGFGGNQTISRIENGADRLRRLIQQPRRKPVPRPKLPSRPDMEWGRAAEERAMKWLKRRGYSPKDESSLNRGWDIACGDAKFEVKGRKDQRGAVRLTDNEWMAALRHKARYTLLIFTAPTLDKLKKASPVQIPDPTRTESWKRRVTYEYVLEE